MLDNFFSNKKKREVKAPKRPEKTPKNKYQNDKIPKFLILGGSINPYSGAFGDAERKHLLARTMFGYKKADLDFFKGKNLSESLDILLQYEGSKTPPVNSYYNQATDAEHAPGETWINGSLKTDQVNFLQVRSFQNWTFGRMLNQERSIQEKMTLFWHNHFATQHNGINFSQIIYRHHELLRQNSLGNFKNLLKQVTLDPGMLIYLNGFQNQKNAPDENYARELQELFTLGVDSGYTETDVQEAARLLTGWTLDANGATVFSPARHDTGNKNFSSFYNNQVITGSINGENELDEMLDMICSKDDVSLYLCRKLYRFFVYYAIDDNIESTIIEPLASTLRANNYDILPVLRQLFSSEHFFDQYARGAIIKNPLDYYVSLNKLLETPFDYAGDIALLYNAWEYNTLFSAVSLMEIANPPNVAGWEAYWNGPVYHELWINSATLPFRNQLSDGLIFPNSLRYRGALLYADVISLTMGIDNAENPNVIVDYISNLFYTFDIKAEQKQTLKSILLSGQVEDFYWSVAWQDFLANQSDESKRQIVFFRLFAFYKQIMNMAEFQLS